MEIWFLPHKQNEDLKMLNTVSSSIPIIFNLKKYFLNNSVHTNVQNMLGFLAITIFHMINMVFAYLYFVGLGGCDVFTPQWHGSDDIVHVQAGNEARESGFTTHYLFHVKSVSQRCQTPWPGTISQPQIGEEVWKYQSEAKGLPDTTFSLCQAQHQWCLWPKHTWHMPWLGMREGEISNHTQCIQGGRPDKTQLVPVSEWTPRAGKNPSYTSYPAEEVEV